MTVYELIEDNAEMLALMQRNGVGIGCLEYLEAYRRFAEIRRTEGGKKVYAVAKVSAEFGIPERTVWRFVKRFSRQAKP